MGFSPPRARKCDVIRINIDQMWMVVFFDETRKAVQCSQRGSVKATVARINECIHDSTMVFIEVEAGCYIFFDLFVRSHLSPEAVMQAQVTANVDI